METISIAKDFSKNPGARYGDDGDFSGELFYKELLLPAFERAINSKQKLTIDLNGIYGFPSSFVSESFGKLSIEKGANNVISVLVFISDENPIRAEKAIAEIKSPIKDEQ